MFFNGYWQKQKDFIDYMQKPTESFAKVWKSLFY